jgi:hypothetical protein
MEKIMKKRTLFVTAALFVSAFVASAQGQTLQDKPGAPSEFQGTTPDKPAIATVPEAATDTPGVPVPQTSGQAPNVSRKMGAEMDSAGDQRTSPDEQ